MSIDLAFERLDGERPERTALFLHGILGRGANLHTIAKRFVEARSGWSARLMDLRGHGRSPKSTPLPSVEAAADDVLAAASKSDLPVSAIIGHSFGGKVALDAARLDRTESLQHIVTIDAVPSARVPLTSGDSALAIMEMIESLPRTFASKKEFVDRLMSAGISRVVAEWLATSLAREDGGVRFGLDLSEIRALTLDYFARDLWPVVEHPPGAARVHVIIAADSDSYSPSDRERALNIGAANGRVTVDILRGSHWLHVDNPDGLLNTLLDRLD